MRSERRSIYVVQLKKALSTARDQHEGSKRGPVVTQEQTVAPG